MDIDGLKATIRAGNSAAEAGAKTLARVASEVADAAELARRTIHDSRNENAQTALNRLVEVEREVERTLRRFDAAIQHADAYLRVIG